MHNIQPCFTDKSVYGTEAPLWQLDIRLPDGLDPGHAHISLTPELFAFTSNRSAIDELASVLAMHLHTIAREQTR
jgi:hypothetical protein